VPPRCGADPALAHGQDKRLNTVFAIQEQSGSGSWLVTLTAQVSAYDLPRGSWALVVPGPGLGQEAFPVHVNDRRGVALCDNRADARGQLFGGSGS
jgi:hypothetical protein